MNEWWAWEWNTHSHGKGSISFDYLVRWRRGWFSLYKIVTEYDHEVVTEWRLYLPFNINVGIEVRRKTR
jgi:hypothetical protein